MVDSAKYAPIACTLGDASLKTAAALVSIALFSDRRVR